MLGGCQPCNGISIPILLSSLFSPTGIIVRLGRSERGHGFYSPKLINSILDYNFRCLQFALLVQHQGFVWAVLGTEC